MHPFRPTAFAAALLAGLLAACGPADQPASAPTPPPAADTAAPPAPVAVPDSMLRMAAGRLGPLRLGMSENELRGAVPAERLRRTTRPLEGTDYPVYELRDPAAPPETPPVLLELSGGAQQGYRLWRIQVRDARYRTAAGIGPGSTYGEARRAYGIRAVERADAGPVALAQEANFTWMLAPSGLPPAPTIDTVPADTRIVGVILYQ